MTTIVLKELPTHVRVFDPNVAKLYELDPEKKYLLTEFKRLADPPGRVVVKIDNGTVIPIDTTKSIFCLFYTLDLNKLKKCQSCETIISEESHELFCDLCKAELIKNSTT